VGLFKGISKETKVGTLAAVSITVLILGYNYMVGKDNPLGGARDFVVLYDSAQGLADNTAVMYNGFRVGQLRKMEMDPQSGKIVTSIEIYSEVKIPKNSKIKIESALLGSTTLKLIPGNSKLMAEDGDTLLPMYTQDVMSMVNEKIAPIAAGADSLLTHLNAIIARQSLTAAVDQLPVVLASLNNTIAEIQSTLAASKPGLTATLNNAAKFSSNLDQYNKSIEGSLSNIHRTTARLDSIELHKIGKDLEETAAALAVITRNIEQGKGSLGKLAKDPVLYDNLVKTTRNLETLAYDINHYPEKFLPLPWGKSQRKKAKRASEKKHTQSDTSR
jgi:phospholipid/cholesterol/gamma-HCH transport system substrate-binding protein